MKKTAIITGASGGIGKSIALKLAHTHDHIALTGYHHPEHLEELREQLTSSGVNCMIFTGNAGSYEFVKQCVSDITQAWGQIDTLVNNAGISYIGLLTDMSIEDWDLILKTNLSSIFYYCHEVIPHMVHRKQGRILNISSVWGEVGASCEAAYAATKGGINALTMSLGKELAPSNVAVNAISCGVIDTPMNHCFSAEEKAALANEIPYGRMASPEEVAEFAAHIIDSPSYLTGQILRFDGGWI